MDEDNSRTGMRVKVHNEIITCKRSKEDKEGWREWPDRMLRIELNPGAELVEKGRATMCLKECSMTKE